jgi:hypothetical protein
LQIVSSYVFLFAVLSDVFQAIHRKRLPSVSSSCRPTVLRGPNEPSANSIRRTVLIGLLKVMMKNETLPQYFFFLR